MGKWKTYTLGEINCYKGSSINPMITPDTTYELYSVPSWDSKYPEIVKGKDIGSTKQIVNKNDVLLCKINPRINRVWVVEQYTEHPLIASSEWIIIRNEQLISKYLYYYFQSPRFRDLLVSEQSGIGGSLTRAQPKRVAMYPVPLPPLDVQQKIADVLDKTSTLIELRKAQLDKLDLLIKSLFIEMFGDPVTNPMGWDEGTIRDIVSEVRYGTSRPAVDDGKYPYLRMNNITYGGQLDLSDVKSIDVPDEELDRCSVRRGDVLFNRTNSKELVGKTCVYNRDDLMVLAGFVIRVRVNERALPEFLSAYLNSDYSKSLLLTMCKAAIGQANINAQELQNISIYIPSMELQSRFVAVLNQVDKSKYEIQMSLVKLETLKKALVQEYFG